mmetsp:Transcript_25570/g.79537  ORF Transcript_25570/g.79537 Transcript_25570/m.79537 type:complete len:124 (-) Transcript_25570:617-988(-)
MFILAFTPTVALAHRKILPVLPLVLLFPFFWALFFASARAFIIALILKQLADLNFYCIVIITCTFDCANAFNASSTYLICTKLASLAFKLTLLLARTTSSDVTTTFPGHGTTSLFLILLDLAA